MGYKNGNKNETDKSGYIAHTTHHTPHSRNCCKYFFTIRMKMGKKRTKYATIINLLDVRLEHCTLLPFELRSALQLWQRHNHRQSKSKAQPHLHARSQIMQQQKLKRCWKDWRTICSYFFLFSIFILFIPSCSVWYFSSSLLLSWFERLNWPVFTSS